MEKKSSVPAFIDFVLRRPWTVVALCALVAGALATNLRHLRPSISYEDMLSADLPQLIDYKTIQADYVRDDNLQVLVEARGGDAFDKEVLSAVHDLVGDLWKTPHSIRVDAVTNFQHTRASGDDLVVADLVPDPEALDARAIRRVREVALGEPLLRKRLVSADGRALAINVNFAFPNETAQEKLDAVAYVRALTQEAEERYPGIETYITGLVALDETAALVVQGDTSTFMGLVFVVVTGLLVLILRSVLPILASLLVFVLSMVCGLALAGFMGWKMTPMTASVPMVILILAVADCVHLLTTFLHNMRQGLARQAAMRESLRVNFQPVAITSITTAIGFLTLNFSDSAAINALGNQVAFGVCVAFALSVTLLPALVCLLPVRVKAQPDGAADYSRFAGWLYRHRVSTLVVSALVTLCLGYGLQRNEFNDQIPKYFHESLPYRKAQDFADLHFGGTYNLTYSLLAGRDGGITDPHFLASAERFVDWLRAQPEVSNVSSVTDTFKRLSKSMHGDDPAWYRLPQDREQASQYLLLYEMSLPYGLDLNDQINMDKSGIRIQANFRTLSTEEILAMERRIGGWLEANLAGVDFVGSGVQLMFAHLFKNDVRGMIYGTTLALVLISFLLVFALRSLRVGLISVAPNLFPALIGFGIWGLWVGEIGIGLAMVSGMTIGIVVDDTVHFLSKYLRGRRERDLEPREAVAYAFNTAGPSIVITSVVLVAGFLVMGVFSLFRMNADIGRMTAMIMALALVFDLVFLPAFLMLFDRTQRPGRMLAAA